MTNVQIEAGTLTANIEERVVTGLLLPYGEVGRTNLGKFSVKPEAVILPRDPSVVTINSEHMRDAPLGRATALRSTPEGVVGTFKIADTEEGDELLAEIADDSRPDARRSLSAEVANVVIRAGEMIAGKLFGAAFCVKGAFPSAALLASDVGDKEDLDAITNQVENLLTALKALQNPSDNEDEENPSTPEAPTSDANASEEVQITNEGNSEMTELNAAAPAGLPLPGASKDGLRIETSSDLFAAVAKANETKDNRMFAALADVTETGIANNITVPQYVGELWEGVGYERQYAPLFNQAQLTSHRISGYRWVTKPQVGLYAGDKAEIPSNAVSTEPVSIDSQRIAGGHDIDRRFRDFNDNSFFESYYRAMSESYAIVSDGFVLSEVVGELTPVAPNGLAPAGTNAALAGVVQGFFSVLRQTRTRPTFALVADDLLEELMFTQESERLAYLESVLGVPVSSGFFVPSPDLAPGQVLVGTKSAVTVHELGGGAPIRVEALDVARGGVDAAVFGYLAVNVHNTKGLALIDTTLPAA